jgi:NAD(P)-dependent dehydrogenase (short-subunit alcohol dehydrogenase family)
VRSQRESKRRPEKPQSEKPSFPLRGKVALITGATRGIGLSIARALAAQQCNLILTARDQAALDRVNRELASKRIDIFVQSCDVRDPQSIDELFQSMKRRFRTIDILVNNAGIAQPNLAIEQLPFSIWKAVFETNLDGMFLITQSALGKMKRGGTIVNNLSIAANRVFAGSAAYNASKHGALGFTNTLREELRPRGIRVISLLPGATDTDIWKTLWPEAPRGKMMSPEIVADAVVSAILLPSNATVERIELLPTSGTL